MRRRKRLTSMSILFFVAVACVLTAALLPVLNAVLSPLFAKADR